MSNDFPYYFICHDCAIEKGGVPPKYPCTVHRDTCPYCKEKKTLWATTDFSYPKLGKEAIWD